MYGDIERGACSDRAAWLMCILSWQGSTIVWVTACKFQNNGMTAAEDNMHHHALYSVVLRG
jgi:hypothetical protein